MSFVGLTSRIFASYSISWWKQRTFSSLAYGEVVCADLEGAILAYVQRPGSVGKSSEEVGKEVREEVKWLKGKWKARSTGESALGPTDENATIIALSLYGGLDLRDWL